MRNFTFIVFPFTKYIGSFFYIFFTIRIKKIGTCGDPFLHRVLIVIFCFLLFYSLLSISPGNINDYFVANQLSYIGKTMKCVSVYMRVSPCQTRLPHSSRFALFPFLCSENAVF